jgi:hypothetical protein
MPRADLDRHGQMGNLNSRSRGTQTVLRSPRRQSLPIAETAASVAQTCR